MTAIEKGIVPGVYHFSNEGVISWYDFTKAIHRLAGITTCHVRPLHTSEYPTPAHRPHYSVLDKTKLKQAYGIEIPYWEESSPNALPNCKIYNSQINRKGKSSNSKLIIVNQEIERRRTFAIISHPDAGKTTLTEKFLLFGGQIQVAGAVKNNKIKKTATSDWMDIEKQRGISVSAHRSWSLTIRPRGKT